MAKTKMGRNPRNRKRKEDGGMIEKKRVVNDGVVIRKVRNTTRKANDSINFPSASQTARCPCIHRNRARVDIAAEGEGVIVVVRRRVMVRVEENENGMGENGEGTRGDALRRVSMKAGGRVVAAEEEEEEEVFRHACHRKRRKKSSPN